MSKQIHQETKTPGTCFNTRNPPQQTSPTKPHPPYTQQQDPLQLSQNVIFLYYN
jgi:hypothetical protein